MKSITPTLSSSYLDIGKELSFFEQFDYFRLFLYSFYSWAKKLKSKKEHPFSFFYEWLYNVDDSG